MTATLHPVSVTDPPVMPLPPGIPPLPILQPRQKPGGMKYWHRIVRLPSLGWQHLSAWRILWATRKLAFLERGFRTYQDEGVWYLEQYLGGEPGAHFLTPMGVDALQRALNHRAQPSLPTLAAFVGLPDIEELPELPPLQKWIEEKLKDYQIQPARQIYRAVTRGLEEWGYNGCWDCSDFGTGKTYQTLGGALETGLEIGIICPKSVIGTLPAYGNTGTGWLGAFAHFGQRPAFVMNYEALKTGRREPIRRTGDPGKPFQWNVDPRHTLLIFDEAHLLKNASLNRSMAFAAIRQGFACIFASGTMAAKPSNLAATGVAVGLHTGERASYEQFLKDHGGIERGPQNWIFPKGRKGAFHLTRIHRKVFPRRGARVRIADLGDRFPENEIFCDAIDTEATAAIAEAWREADQEIFTLKEKRGHDASLGAMESAAYMKAWHASERAKVPNIVELANRELEAERSVAVFVNFSDVREALQKAMHTRCAIYGGQNDYARNAAIADFMADRSRVIVANIKAGGLGISLHDTHGNHPRTSIILPTNDAVVMKQAFGRIHRAGGMSKSRQIVVFAAGTIEEEICVCVRGKMNHIDSLNDGDLCPRHVF